MNRKSFKQIALHPPLCKRGVRGDLSVAKIHKSPSVPLMQSGRRFEFSKGLLGPAALMIALAGCSMMPEYQRPAAPVSAAWPENIQHDSIRPGDANKTAGTTWQQYFSDPRLQALIAVALENNRDLRIATARIAEARAQYGIQHADRFPTVNLSGSRSASLTPASASSTGNDLHVQRYDAGLSLVSYELDFWGRVGSLDAAAKASYLSTEAAQRAFRLSLIADVANAYLSLLEMSERSRFADETVRTRAATKELIARRRELGVSGDLEFLQSEGAYQASLAERANLERQQAAAENLLNLLLGKSMGELKELPAGRSLAEQGMTPDRVAGLPAELLLQRPDVMAAEHKLIAANANIGAARAAFFPRISLTGSMGVASRNLSGLFDSDNKAWAFQPALTLPLFDAGRTSANVDVAEARKVVAVAEYEKTIQQAFREVADLLNARGKLAEQLAAQLANAEAQKQRTQLVDARFKAGIANHLEVLDAQRESFAAEQGAIQVRRMWLSANAQLYKALGGEGNAADVNTSSGVAVK